MKFLYGLLRGGLYTAISTYLGAVLAKHGLPLELGASVIGALFLALDHHFGFHTRADPPAGA
jgi:hypothetical protein